MGLELLCVPRVHLVGDPRVVRVSETPDDRGPEYPQADASGAGCLLGPESRRAGLHGQLHRDRLADGCRHQSGQRHVETVAAVPVHLFANGVTDNFIKIGLYRGHDWHDARQNQKVTRNLAHAAALARYAGLKGLALDLEPYKPTWGGSAGGPELAKLVEAEGRKMGQAMHDAYPDMTLFVLPDVLRQVEHENKASSDRGDKHHNGYGLAAPFVRGLLSIPWARVVIGSEFTYSAHAERIPLFMQQAAKRYRDEGPRDAAMANFSIAPGLWPLGPNAKDKSARFSPAEFRQRLQVAFDTSKQYVWIYGSSSAWQKDGPLGPVPGPVATSFQ